MMSRRDIARYMDVISKHHHQGDEPNPNVFVILCELCRGRKDPETQNEGEARVAFCVQSR